VARERERERGKIEERSSGTYADPTIAPKAKGSKMLSLINYRLKVTL